MSMNKVELKNSYKIIQDYDETIQVLLIPKGTLVSNSQQRALEFWRENSERGLNSVDNSLDDDPNYKVLYKLLEEHKDKKAKVNDSADFIIIFNVNQCNGG